MVGSWYAPILYIVEDSSSKKMLYIGIVAILILIGGLIWFWLKKEVEVPKEKGVVETAKTISESVPEIQTNPGEKVPEVNPLDRANPFKYTNPLR